MWKNDTSDFLKLKQIILTLYIQHTHTLNIVTVVCKCKFISFTSAHRHFPAPGSVRSAHTMLRASSEQETRLARIHEHVAERHHVHPHHGGMQRAPRLLARMGCRNTHCCYWKNLTSLLNQAVVNYFPVTARHGVFFILYEPIFYVKHAGCMTVHDGKMNEEELVGKIDDVKKETLSCLICVCVCV